MNVEIGADAAQFPEKEYLNGIAFAVHHEVTQVCQVSQGFCGVTDSAVFGESS